MNDTKEVRFDLWCSKCERADVDENSMNPNDTCWDCLHEPMNIDSHKPLFFKEKQKVESKGD